MPLDEYKRKRDFSATPEPSGDEDAAAKEHPLSFVIHKHDASRLHYDLRLELDGVLLSWAIPKGPSFDTHERRLAVHVEDHPLDYGGFEGNIPKGEYGGGSVVIWDRGTWEPAGDAHAMLEKGDLKFHLHGEKLEGLWVLVRMRPRPGEKAENWLLIKERDEFARPHEAYDVTAERPESVISGRTNDEVAAEAGPGAAAPVRESAAGLRAAGAGPSGSAERVSASGAGVPDTGEPASIPLSPPDPRQLSGSTPASPPTGPLPEPSKIEFELATLVEEAPEGPGWLAEAKYDGYRVIVALDEGRARAFTRSHADWSDRFSAICRAAQELPARSAIIDGEAVVFDEAGISQFELMQGAFAAHPERIVFVGFDLLELNGHDVRGLPLVQRKELLRTLLADQPAGSLLRYAEHIDSHAADLYTQACSQGLEGVMCKRSESRYIAGRGRDWLKVKCRHTQELVVGGYTEGNGARASIGSLLVGYYEGDRLVYAGRVGSGLGGKMLDALLGRFKALATDSAPFDPAPKSGGKTIHWVKPELVIESQFREWTSEGLLRQPVFLGIREDVSARQVVRERPVSPEAAESPEPAVEGDPPPARGSSKKGYGAETTVAGVRISNPEKPLFADSEFTKLDLASYYAAVAPAMLPHVSERLLTLVRCPTGLGRGCFYQRHPDMGVATHVHPFAHTLTDHPEAEDYLYIDSAEGLVALAQMGVLEIHTWQSQIDAPTQPDRIVFDLDPGPGVDWEQLCDGARSVRETCSELGFEPFLKSTGSKGLHVVLPIEPVWDFVHIRAFSKAIVDRLAAAAPDKFTAKMAKDQRGGKVYLDYLRNAETSSAVAAYSTRNRPGPSCAVPLAWEELVPGLDITAFTPARVIERVSTIEDPWAAIDEHPAGSRTLKSAEKALG